MKKKLKEEQGEWGNLLIGLIILLIIACWCCSGAGFGITDIIDIIGITIDAIVASFGGSDDEIHATPTTRVIRVATPTPTLAPIKHPTGATAKCKDGTWSYSKTRSGTCSGHKGVQYWIND